ncbi:hypothetical protein [Akkermansia sp.]
MKRISFNAGELSPELLQRSDLDAFHRGASTLINWDVSQMGGIRRRRGMLPLAEAWDHSRLAPYIYSNSGNERFLIEVSGDALRVLSPDSSEELARFDAEFGEVESLRWKQVNNLLLFTHPACPPHVLKRENSQWKFEPFSFKAHPWRHIGYRDDPVLILTQADGSYSVVLPDSLPDAERSMESGDILRASFYTEQQEAFSYRSSLLAGVRKTELLSPTSSFASGARLALRGDSSLAYYVCIKDLEAGSFINGLNAPENYPDNFLKAESTDGFDALTPISGLSERNYTKNEKLVLKSGYWEYFTCIRAFSGADDYVEGAVSPADYPGHFVRGLPIGDALPCKGNWEFYCSGGWYGSYEVRRSYDGPGLDREWEMRGSSFSRLGAASNTLITGTESGEECHVRLFLTRSKYVDDSLENGFPDDTCSNKLVVSSYKHDMLLKYTETMDEDTDVPVASGWQYVSPIKHGFTGRREVIDWSWCAFRPAYGYPILAEIFGQRLVFASTAAQPQSLWMSKTDDLNNFDTGTQDDSALALTLSTTSQNGICWLMAHSFRLLLGTADAEYIISSGNAASLTHATVRVENHGYVGSAPVPAIMAVDKVLYCERGGGRLYQYGYDFQSDSYVSRDLTVFADHILAQGGGVTGGTILRKPEARAVFTLKDGTLALMTYNSMHEVHCWHRYETAGKITSVVSLPNGTDSDSLFLAVDREEGRYLEVIRDDDVYVDHDRLDYTSTLVTNALTSVEAKVQKAPVATVQVCLAGETLVDGVEVSCDGMRWDKLDRNDRTLPTGWNNLITSGHWDYETVVGLRVHGDRPLRLLALQG